MTEELSEGKTSDFFFSIFKVAANYTFRNDQNIFKMFNLVPLESTINTCH